MTTLTTLSSQLRIWGVAALAAACATVMFAPLTSAEPDGSWRKNRPASGPEVRVSLPKFEKLVLENGLTVLHAPVDALPVVSFSVVSRGGIARDPKALAGLTSITYAMLEEGAGELDALAFSDAVADLGASFGTVSERDHGLVTISGLSRNREAMMKLLADAVLRPRLEAKDFERLKKRRIASLLERRGSPMGLASEVLPSVLYGDQHPYGHPPEGVVQTMEKIELEDVRKQHQATFIPSESALVVAGKIDREEAERLAKAHFGTWPKREDSAPLEVPGVDAKKRSDIVVLNKEDSPQTFIAMGRPLFPKGHADEVAMSVLNDIFGGNFTSRLNLNLREEKGYTYGATSQSSYRLGAGVFLAYSAVRQDVSGESLKEFFQELKNLTKHPPTAEEVARAKSGIVRSLPGSFETTGAVAGAAAQLFVYRLPLDYYDTLADRYQAVTRDQVLAASKKYLLPEKMQVVLVGDADKIRKKVEALKLGKWKVQSEAPSSAPTPVKGKASRSR